MLDKNSYRKTLEQGRAAFAFDKAKEAKENLKDKAPKEYKAYVKKMPMLIKTNGLGAAMAFAFAKGSKNGELQKNKAWGLLYIHIEEWLKADTKDLILFEEDRLVEQLTKETSSTYRAVTVEILAFLGWLRRFAEGLIEGENETD